MDARRDDQSGESARWRQALSSALVSTLYLLTELLTRLAGTGETARDADDDRQTQAQVSETRRDAGDAQDARRMAHNPEVAGSNPAPTTR